MRRCIQRTLAGTIWLAFMWQARAQDAPASPVTGCITVVNDYLFRGISQTNGKPAVQAGLEYAAASGWYIDGWGSNISWISDASTAARPISSSLEFDAYGGYRGTMAGGVNYDFGLYEYYYPGTYPYGYTRPYTLEGYGILGWKDLKLEYYQSIGNLFGNPDSKNSRYVRLSWHHDIAPNWQLNAHLGHQTVANHAGFGYADWKVGVARNFAHGYAVELAYYDTNARRAPYTNADGYYLGRATGILSLSKSF